MTGDKMLIKAKSSISRLLKQSILELCKASVPQGQGLEIDGIVCVSFGEDSDQIVVKVHERLGNFCQVSDATSTETKETRPMGSDVDCGVIFPDASYTQSPDAHSNLARPIEVAPSYDMNGEEVGENGDSPFIRRIAATPIWRQNRPPQPPVAVRNPAPADKPRVILTPPKVPFTLKANAHNPASNGPRIKTEKESLLEEEAGGPKITVPDVSASPATPLPAPAVQTDSLARRSDVVCEHCHLVCASFDELKEHNDTAHGAYTCSYCWRSYLHYTNYALHLKRHRATPSRRNLPIEHTPRMSPIIPLGVKTGHKARCGVCGEATRTHTTMIQHLKAIHEFEHCFTCSTCMEYFPNRNSFVIHRKLAHADINQCRCERCDVFFTYVEFKVHERECLASPAGNYLTHAISEMNGRQESEVPMDMSNHRENNEKENEPGNYAYINKLLQSEESLRDQVKALRKPRVDDSSALEDADDGAESNNNNNGHGASDDDAYPENQASIDVEEEEMGKNGTDSKLGEDREAMASIYYPLVGSRSRSPVESENSRESSKDAAQVNDGTFDASLHSPATSSSSAQRQAIKSLDSLGATCPGPFRCQSCFQISEQFEEYEMHCYEMHNRFVCPFCAQSFANKRNLHRHVRKHTGEMPYMCVECGEKFYRDDDLRRHKISKHSQSKSDFSSENIPVADMNIV